eukprot:COSAG02_NODE_5075_length_4661_cov_4.005261_7_plen_198_part_00
MFNTGNHSGHERCRGPIHPRLKKPVGQRAAIAAMAIAYPPNGRSAAESAANPTKPYTGPTISGCGVSGSKLTVKFNSSLLAGGKIEVQKYNKTNTQAFRALVNSSLFCLQPGLGCIVGGTFCHETKPDCVHKVSVCREVPAAHGQPAHQVCADQPRCKNATSGAYDAPLVAGCIDHGPPTIDEIGDGVTSRRTLLAR